VTGRIPLLDKPSRIGPQRPATASDSELTSAALALSEGLPPTRILRIDAGARRAGSFGRPLTDRLVAGLLAQHAPAIVSTRNLAAEALPFVDESWVQANAVPAADRTAAQREALTWSDILVAEIKAADIVVISCPIYNFGVPAALKAWVDQVCRARVTFAYTDAGPQGLLMDKKAYVVVTSGGTMIGSGIDFATGYLRHVLGFIGITDVELIGADRLMIEGEAKVERARNEIDRFLAASDRPTS